MAATKYLAATGNKWDSWSAVYAAKETFGVFVAIAAFCGCKTAISQVLFRPI